MKYVAYSTLLVRTTKLVKLSPTYEGDYHNLKLSPKSLQHQKKRHIPPLKEQAYVRWFKMTISTLFNSKIRSRQTTIVFQGAVAINTIILIIAVPVAIDRTDSELRNKCLASSPPKPSRVNSEKRRKFEDLIEANRRRIDGNFPNLLASQIELGVF